jgi:uridine phosphorylase
METSAIYGLGRLLGHNCLAINAIVANRVQQEFSKDSKATIEKLITTFLDIFSREI